MLESPTNLVLIGPFIQGPAYEFPIKPLLAIFAIDGSLDRDGLELGVDLGDQHFLQDDPPT